MTTHQPKFLSCAGWHTRGYLPHFDGGAIPQFVTFRLADSFPHEFLQLLEEELKSLNRLEAEQERYRRIEDYLDQGHGSLWLSIPEVANLVMQALLFYDNRRYHLHAWCIMPNHVHTLFTPSSDCRLSQVVHSWKSFTANKANAILKRTGTFWQAEYFDRFMRDQHQFDATLAYVENNPVKAGLCESPEKWRYSSAFRG